MTDISKCHRGCHQQENCHRWTTPTTVEYQSYTDFRPEPSGNCKYFIGNVGKVKEIKG